MAITYRTAGMRSLAVFFFVWLIVWTIVCGFFTYKVLFGGLGADCIGLLFIFWGGELAVLGIMLVHLRTLTVFTFYPDRLVLERMLLHSRRQLSIPKEKIEVVRQIKDGGEDDDCFPSWCLAIEGRSNIELLSRQDIEKSAWLGPIVAHWAGVEYVSSNKKNYEEV